MDKINYTDLIESISNLNINEKNNRYTNINNNEIYLIIKIQAVCRRYLSNKNNIFMKLKTETLQKQFNSEIEGYHMINKTPIKESVWEEINCNIVDGVCCVTDEANGNHISGKDNRFDNVNISNKSTKTNGNTIEISSYRLTSVCNDKVYGNEQDIIDEIEKRDKSFDYYSILIRNEKKNSIIEYNWYIIPKDYYLFKIDKLTLKIGKKGKKKGEIIGWQSKYCDIRFSMSSQLWYEFNICDIEKYKICSNKIDNSKSKINYSQIYYSFINTF
tara:strand:+ start:823 stop:1641 length:819 start_codon:yes stop_codon:yes gene_type:complete